MTLCFDDLMATMSAQDPVFDTFSSAPAAPRLWGAAGWPSLCSPCWPGCRQGHGTSWPTTWPLLRVSRKQAYIADTNLKILLPPSRRGGPSGPAAEIHPGGA